MTISYNYSVSTSRPWTLFKVLFRWRGSLWKVVVFDLLMWITAYSVISVVYRCFLPDSTQRTFEKVIVYCNNRAGYIPLNFVLGFFVSTVVTRWMMLFQLLGFIENVALLTSEYVRGTSDKARMIRRNIVRYCILGQVLIFRDISMRTRRRFPTLDTVIATGFMMPHEKLCYDEIEWKGAKYWVPFQWAFALLYRAREEGLVESDFYQVALQEEIKQFRSDTAKLAMYDMVPIPIIYPQVVFLAVHFYFGICLLGRQFIIDENLAVATSMDIYVPFMTILQFLFYMGWLKVGEVMLNPFGEDDDDFECNALIDRNITLALSIVDKGYDQAPDVRKDSFWDKAVVPLYSEETANDSYNSMKGSVSHVILPPGEHKIKMVPHFESVPSLARKRTLVAARRSGERKRRASDSAAPSRPLGLSLSRRSMAKDKYSDDSDEEELYLKVNREKVDVHHSPKTSIGSESSFTQILIDPESSYLTEDVDFTAPRKWSIERDAESPRIREGKSKDAETIHKENIERKKSQQSKYLLTTLKEEEDEKN